MRTLFKLADSALTVHTVAQALGGRRAGRGWMHTAQAMRTGRLVLPSAKQTTARYWSTVTQAAISNALSLRCRRSVSGPTKVRTRFRDRRAANV